MRLATILLIDHDVAFARSMAERLNRRNFDILIASGKEEAIELMNQYEEIEAILLDDDMPAVPSNFGLLKQMRTLFPLTEVIMLTGHTTFEKAVEGLCQGAFDYLVKICDMDYFVEQIMAAVRQKKQQEEKIFHAGLKALSEAWIPTETALEGFDISCIC